MDGVEPEGVFYASDTVIFGDYWIVGLATSWTSTGYLPVIEFGYGNHHIPGLSELAKLPLPNHRWRCVPAWREFPRFVMKSCEWRVSSITPLTDGRANGPAKESATTSIPRGISFDI